MTTDRTELIAMFVLDSIADDFEAIQEIVEDVKKLGRDCGLDIETSEILCGLRELVDRSLAKAYTVYNRHCAVEISGMPAADEIPKAHFRVTPKGMELELADYEGWPFDKDGNLRQVEGVEGTGDGRDRPPTSRP